MSLGPAADRNFKLNVTQHILGVQVRITTCSRDTVFDSMLGLYEGCPNLGGSTLLKQNDPDFFCAVLFYGTRSLVCFILAID